MVPSVSRNPSPDRFLQAHPVPSSDRVSIIGLPLRAVIRVVDETSRTIPAFLNENRLDVSDRPSGLYTMLSEDRAVRFIVAHFIRVPHIGS